MIGPVGLGVGIAPQMTKDRPAVAEQLGAAWWHDWGCSFIGSVGYVPSMYRLLTFPISTHMANHPGLVWLGPNEPESHGQANMTPADCVGEVKKAQKRSARMTWPAICLTPTAIWPLQWFDRFAALWDGPEPKMLQLHLYGVAGGTAWNSLFDDWYRFLGTLGLDHIPTIVSETNQDHGNADQQLGMLRFLAYKLTQDERLQAVGWFAAYWPGHGAVNLIDAYGELTALGREFRALQT